MNIELCDEFYYYISNKDLRIEQLFNSCGDNILRNNNKLNVYEGEWVKIKVNKYISHFVKPAESLDDISKQYSIDKEKIKKDNNLETNRLYVGQMLKIYKEKPTNH